MYEVTILDKVKSRCIHMGIWCHSSAMRRCWHLLYCFSSVFVILVQSTNVWTYFSYLYSIRAGIIHLFKVEIVHKKYSKIDK